MNFFPTPLGVISLVQCRWADFLYCPSVLTPPILHTHTRTHIHFALRERRFRHYFCLTATQTGLQTPGDSSPIACRYTHTHLRTHSSRLTCSSPFLQNWRHVEVAWARQHMCVIFCLYTCHILKRGQLLSHCANVFNSC